MERGIGLDNHENVPIIIVLVVLKDDVYVTFDGRNLSRKTNNNL